MPLSAEALAAGAAGSSLLLGWGVPATVRLTTGRGRRATIVALPLVVCLLLPGAGLPLALIAATATAGGRVLWRRRQETRQAEATAARMLETCDLLASELSAGRPAGAALDEAASAWPVLRPVAEACRLGGDVHRALRTAARTPGADGLRLLAGAWAVSHRTGAGLAESTRRVADAVRLDQATRRVVAGELASARATAKLVALLPVMALLMGTGAGGDPWTFLVRTPFGLACLGGGLAVGFAGLWWIELIAREVER